jgi:hypothetical protein
MAVGTDVPWCSNTIWNASVDVLFGYELIAIGVWNCGGPSYSISSGKVVGK